MARADRRRAEREARHVQRRPRASGGGTRVAEQTGKANPTDTDALTQLAGLELRKAVLARARAQAIQPQTQGSFAGQLSAPNPTSQLGKALQSSADPLPGADPINTAVQTQ